ncbi:MAG: DUF1501 domain-containing protein [Verrucomicrobiales bacterium]|nr:DUF1501 domain-containing protein [Verrucomicrobiales bacterium]
MHSCTTCSDPHGQPLPLTRRQILSQAGFGIGSLALAGVLSDMGLTAQARAFTPSPSSADSLSPLAPRQSHFPGKAKRVIHLFMNGGPSQIDTFDPKPLLKKFHGKTIPAMKGLAKDRRLGGAAFASPFTFSKHGESGMEISELFPQLAQHADKLCVIRSMFSDIPNHEQGFMMMNCGNIALPRPSVGAWTLYGLGTENQSLPGFVVMCPNGMPTAQSSNWRSAFLPGIYQGTYINTKETDPEELIANLQNDYLFPDQQRHQLSYIQQLNRLHAKQRPSDPQLEARIESLELAFRMQSEATDAFDIAREPTAVRERYGDNIQGRQTLIARRLAERGVRYVQVYHRAGQPWDSHASLEANHRRLASECDQAIAALLTDLAERGMLEDTLVIWGGEMGRTPTAQLPLTPKIGRDHHTDGFTVWLAGGGVKGGTVYGSTDEIGLSIAEDKVHVHDLHATILHLLGFNHEALTYRYAGRNFRLTDIFGNVVQDILA